MSAMIKSSDVPMPVFSNIADVYTLLNIGINQYIDRSSLKLQITYN